MAITLLELQQRIAGLINCQATRDVWVTAELSDVAVRGAHCYMELLQKSADGSQNVARARACIWNYHRSVARQRFHSATGAELTNGIKVMVCVSVSYHPVFGLSMVITDINPEFTMGDVERRRREILARLQAEGVLGLNRELTWPVAPQRIAIISAPNAAGFGDFVKHLFLNPHGIRFSARLFTAIMQGDRAPSSVIAALDAIAAEQDQWDCVVIIRGGGSTSDLLSFEDFSLAEHVAQFPLPVVVGIGHDRDITVLDYVGNMCVKTPTAAADWLINRCRATLDAVESRVQAIYRCVSERLASEKEHLAYLEATLPTAPTTALARAALALQQRLVSLSGIGASRIVPQRARLDGIASSIPPAVEAMLRRAVERLDDKESLLKVLSPEATLKRGYSITRVAGYALTSAAGIAPDTVIETILADGTITSRTL